METQAQELWSNKRSNKHGKMQAALLIPNFQFLAPVFRAWTSQCIKLHLPFLHKVRVLQLWPSGLAMTVCDCGILKFFPTRPASLPFKRQPVRTSLDEFWDSKNLSALSALSSNRPELKTAATVGTGAPAASGLVEVVKLITCITSFGPMTSSRHLCTILHISLLQYSSMQSNIRCCAYPCINACLAVC